MKWCCLPFQVGDIVSVIDMPPTDDTIWWRGKRGFEVSVRTSPNLSTKKQFFRWIALSYLKERKNRQTNHILLKALVLLSWSACMKTKKKDFSWPWFINIWWILFIFTQVSLVTWTSDWYMSISFSSMLTTNASFRLFIVLAILDNTMMPCLLASFLCESKNWCIGCSVRNEWAWHPHADFLIYYCVQAEMLFIEYCIRNI